jgi:hypothetical protein
MGVWSNHAMWYFHSFGRIFIFCFSLTSTITYHSQRDKTFSWGSFPSRPYLSVSRRGRFLSSPIMLKLPLVSYHYITCNTLTRHSPGTKRFHGNVEMKRSTAWEIIEPRQKQIAKKKKLHTWFYCNYCICYIYTKSTKRRKTSLCHLVLASSTFNFGDTVIVIVYYFQYVKIISSKWYPLIMKFSFVLPRLEPCTVLPSTHVSVLHAWYYCLIRIAT